MAKIVLSDGRVAKSPDEVMEQDMKLKAVPSSGKHVRAIDARKMTHWSVTDLGREVLEVTKTEASNG